MDRKRAPRFESYSAYKYTNVVPYLLKLTLISSPIHKSKRVGGTLCPVVHFTPPSPTDHSATVTIVFLHFRRVEWCLLRPDPTSAQ